MGWQLPAYAPKNTYEAFAFVNGLSKGATLDDLKILALTEALGKELYFDLAERAEHPEVKELLRANGRDEYTHAERACEVLKILTGESYVLPSITENPLYSPISPMPLTKAALGALAEAELAGEDLYAGIAASFDNSEVKALFALSGREEIEHGHRLTRVAELLPE